MTREKMFAITTGMYLEAEEKKAVESLQSGNKEQSDRDIKRYKDTQRRIENARGGFKALVDGVNGDEDLVLRAMFTEFVNSHRYLQGEMVNTLLKLLSLIGDLPEEMTDARNELAVKTAREIVRDHENMIPVRDIIKRITR